LTNRWRAEDFEKAFKEVGFKIIKINRGYDEKFQVDEKLKSQFHKDFQSYSLKELSAVGLKIIAEK